MTLLHGEPPQDMASAKEFIEEALSIAMHAMRAALHSTLGRSPGSLTFNRDVLLKNSLTAKSVLAREKLVATYSIST